MSCQFELIKATITNNNSDNESTQRETRTLVNSHKTTNVEGSKLLNGIVDKSIFVDGVVNGDVPRLFKGVVSSQESIVDRCGHETRSTLYTSEATGRSSKGGGSAGQHDGWKRCLLTLWFHGGSTISLLLRDPDSTAPDQSKPTDWLPKSIDHQVFSSSFFTVHWMVQKKSTDAPHHHHTYVIRFCWKCRW